MLWRKLPNGDCFAPMRGNPEPPPGYVLDFKNKYLAHPVIPECSYRFLTSEQLSCGKIETIIECSLFDKEVTQIVCASCNQAASE
jgi:hypothetical protein